MRKSIFLSLFLLFSLSTFSQTPKHLLGIKEGFKWTDVNVNRAVELWEGTGIPFGLRPVWEEGSSPAGGLSFGLFYQRILSEITQLQIGLDYSVLAQSFEGEVIAWDTLISPIDNPFSFTFSQVTEASIKSNYSFLDLQIGLRHFLNRNKVSVYLYPYTTLNYFLLSRHNRSARFDNGFLSSTNLAEESKNTEYQKINITLGMGLGAEVPIGMKMKLSLQCSYDQQLKTLIKDSEGKKPRSVNIMAGLAYLFG